MVPAHRIGERAVLVGDELDQLGAGEALVLLPRLHDGGVVDAEDVHLVDPSLLKAAVDLGCLEARDLARRSGGREGAWERDHQHVALGGERLDRQVLLEVDLAPARVAAVRLQAGWSGHGGRCGHGRLGGSGWARACTFTPFGKASPTEMAIPRANIDESARERDAARMPRPRERDAARSMATRLATRRSLRDCQGVTGSHTASFNYVAN